MKKSEFNNIVNNAVTEILAKNYDLIDQHIQTIAEQQPISQDFVACAALCKTLVPSIAAAVTGQLLVSLGLVTLEDND